MVRTTKNRNRKTRTNKKTNKKYDLYNGKKWDSYRLGDVILGQFICWDMVCLNKISNKRLSNKICRDLEFTEFSHTDKENIKWCRQNKEFWTNPKNKKQSYLMALHKNFPNSIASKYITYVGYPNDYSVKNFKIIKKIFTELSYKKPLETSFVIHLRLGDVLSAKYKDEYVYDIDYYENLVNRIKKNKKIKKVDIVTGLHKNVYVKQSINHLNRIVKIFKEFYPVEVIITKNPDKDFYYMCHSKYFSPAGGGFSKLIKEYLKFTKSKIYE